MDVIDQREIILVKARLLLCPIYLFVCAVNVALIVFLRLKAVVDNCFQISSLYRIAKEMTVQCRNLIDHLALGFVI